MLHNKLNLQFHCPIRCVYLVGETVWLTVLMLGI